MRIACFSIGNNDSYYIPLDVTRLESASCMLFVLYLNVSGNIDLMAVHFEAGVSPAIVDYLGREFVARIVYQADAMDVLTHRELLHAFRSISSRLLNLFSGGQVSYVPRPQY